MAVSVAWWIESLQLNSYQAGAAQSNLRNIQDVIDDPPNSGDELVCREWLGGVLKHYERKVA